MFKKFLALFLAIAMIVALWTVPASAASLTKVFSADYRDASSCADRTGNLDLQNQQANVVSAVSYAKEGDTYYITSGSMGNGAYRYMYQIGNYQTLNSIYTMEAYVYISDIVQSETVELFNGGDSPFVKMFWKDGSFGFGYSDDSAAVVDSNDRTLSNSEWYHIVVTNDGSTCMLYVNGQLVGTSASIRVDGLWYFYLAHTAIDGYGVALYNIYNTTATASQVASMYTSCGGVLPTPTEAPTLRPTATVNPDTVTDAFKTVSEDIPVFKAGDTVNIKFDITDIKAVGGLCGLDLTLEYNTGLLTPGDTLSISSSSSTINTSAGSSDCKWWATGRISGKDTANPQIILTMLEDNGNYMVSEDGKIWISVSFTAIADSKDGDSLVNVVMAYGTDSRFTKVDGIGTSVYAFDPVLEKEERQLYISSKPAQSIYSVGEALDITGMAVYISVNGEAIPVDLDKCGFEGFDSSEPGEAKVTVKYETEDAIYSNVFTVTIVENKYAVTGIGLHTKPDKLVYSYGEALDTTGLSLLVKYADGTTAYISEGLGISGYNPTAPGNQSLTVIYEGYTTSFSITVLKRQGDLIFNSKPTKMYYEIGEELDLTGMSVAAKIDGVYTPVAVEDCQITGFNSSAAGDVKISVKYETQDTIYSNVFTLTVLGSKTVVTAIGLGAKPKQLTYAYGEPLNTTGLSILVKYADGSTAYISEGIEVSGYNPTAPGDQRLTVTYQGYTTSFSVKVVDSLKQADLIIVSKPSKMYYGVGEELDLTGMSVAIKVDGIMTSVAVDDCEITGFQSSIPGDIKITVQYQTEFIVYSNVFTLTVTGNEAAVTSVGLQTKPAKLYYKVGEALDTTGLSLLVKYADGTTAFISEGLEVSGYDPTVTGNQRLTVTYKGHTTSFSVSVA